MKHRLAFPAGLVLLLVSLVLLAIQCTPDGQASSSASEDIQPDSDIPGDPPTPSPSEEIQSAPDTPGDLATPPPPEEETLFVIVQLISVAFEAPLQTIPAPSPSD